MTRQSEDWFYTAFPQIIKDGFNPSLSRRMYAIDPDSGGKRALARSILEFSGDWDSYIFVHERGIWPSSENAFIPEEFLKRFAGEDADFDACLAFRRDEQNLADAFLCLVLYNFWGCYFACKENSFFFEISHDEDVALYGASEEQFEEWELTFAMKPLGECSAIPSSAEDEWRA